MPWEVILKGFKIEKHARIRKKVDDIADRLKEFTVKQVFKELITDREESLRTKPSTTSPPKLRGKTPEYRPTLRNVTLHSIRRYFRIDDSYRKVGYTKKTPVYDWMTPDITSEHSQLWTREKENDST
jgi:hypothetical protein